MARFTYPMFRCVQYLLKPSDSLSLSRSHWSKYQVFHGIPCNSAVSSRNSFVRVSWRTTIDGIDLNGNHANVDERQITSRVSTIPNILLFFAQILDQIPIEKHPLKKDNDKQYFRAYRERVADISPIMLISILKVRNAFPVTRSDLFPAHTLEYLKKWWTLSEKANDIIAGPGIEDC